MQGLPTRDPLEQKEAEAWEKKGRPKLEANLIATGASGSSARPMWELVQTAIRTSGKKRVGASRAAIVKSVTQQRHSALDTRAAAALRRVLKQHVEDGDLIQSGQTFKLAPQASPRQKTPKAPRRKTAGQASGKASTATATSKPRDTKNVATTAAPSKRPRTSAPAKIQGQKHVRKPSRSTKQGRTAKARTTLQKRSSGKKPSTSHAPKTSRVSSASSKPASKKKEAAAPQRKH